MRTGTMASVVNIERPIRATDTESRLSNARKLFEPGFELVLPFVGYDEALATEIVTAAIGKLETTARLQEKRFYYTPTRARTRDIMPEPLLLQRLLFAELEPYEKSREQSGRSLTFSEAASSFIKHLYRVVMRYNSFYAMVAVTRILCHISTEWALTFYQTVASPNLAKTKKDSTCRRVKRILQKELGRRFGTLLRLRGGERGESRFLDLKNPALDYPDTWPAGVDAQALGGNC